MPLRNYEKKPFIICADSNKQVNYGWKKICTALSAQLSNKSKSVIVFECYQGTSDTHILQSLRNFLPFKLFLTNNCMKSDKEIDQMVQPDVTDDEVFGYLTRLNMTDFFDADKVSAVRKAIDESNDTVVVYGTGASSICFQSDLMVYLDLSRWEIQQRFRNNEVGNLGATNRFTKTSVKYKRAYFVDWRVCDKLKKSILQKLDFIIDVNDSYLPKMLSGNVYRRALSSLVDQPFRLVPFFDPGIWGGQWMKDKFDLDPDSINYAWAFDCVPEENSLVLKFGNIEFETPAINLVFYESKKLLGEAVQARFGDEFPIRFDMLDTMDGQNLSLQVHPSTTYIQEHFGLHYTQDESYYLLETGEDALVYLGLKDDISVAEVIEELTVAKETGIFDADKYVSSWKAAKHDHFLIPAGTIHCSGRNCMVLEISATPYIFTFKLWDWNRVDLNGEPRPINIIHGQSVLDERNTATKVKAEMINVVTQMDKGEGWSEEKTGLHNREFIETRRHWFTSRVLHQTKGSVNVLNLVEGGEAIVESPSGLFQPFIIHYAETFIVPAAISEYTIRPYGAALGQQCATIKAYVRT